MNKLFDEIPIWKMVAVYLVANILNILMVLPMRYYWGITQDVTDELMRASMFGLVIIWFIWMIFKHKTSLLPEFRNFKNDIRLKECFAVLMFNYALSLVIVFGLVLCLSLITNSSLDHVASSSNGAGISSYSAMMINFIAASFIVPVAEEFMFRGVLLKGLMKKHNVIFSVVVSSILFGITHISLSSLGATVFGVCMCAIYLRTKNIFVPISIHITHNLILSIVQSKGVLWGANMANGFGSMELTNSIAIKGVIGFSIIAILSGTYLVRKYQFFSFKRQGSTASLNE